VLELPELEPVLELPELESPPELPELLSLLELPELESLLEPEPVPEFELLSPPESDLDPPPSSFFVEA